MEDRTNQINMLKVSNRSQKCHNAHTKGKKQYHSTSITSVNSSSCILKALKRYQSQELEIFTNIDKKEIFVKVLKFLNAIIPNQKELQRLIKNMKFQDDIEANESQSLISSEKLSSSQINISVCSSKDEDSSQDVVGPLHEIKDKQKDIRISIQTRISKQEIAAVKKLKESCKISITMGQCIFSQENFSPLVSAESIKTISMMNIPSLVLNLKMVQDIFEQPQPFLINLAICLMLKFLYASKIQLNQSNACWILAVGTIIAYKIYYDEPVEGLIDSFAYILGMKRQDIIDLQICFLNTIEHRALIDRYQYHLVLTKIVMI